MMSIQPLGISQFNLRWSDEIREIEWSLRELINSIMERTDAEERIYLIENVWVQFWKYPPFW